MGFIRLRQSMYHFTQVTIANGLVVFVVVAVVHKQLTEKLS